MIGVRRRASPVALAAITLVGCSRRVEEPNPGPAARPAASAPVSSPVASPPAASPSQGLTATEKREIGTRLHNEVCEAAVKHVNTVYGRKETAAEGIDLLGNCLTYGNVAWNRCILAAKAPSAVEKCNQRLLLRDY